jgi:hypothetical protein
LKRFAVQGISNVARSTLALSVRCRTARQPPQWVFDE